MSVRQCLVHRYRSVRNRRVAHTLFNLFIHRSSVLAHRLKSFLCPVKTFGLLRCGSATAKVRNGKLLFAMPAYKHTHTPCSSECCVAWSASNLMYWHLLPGFCAVPTQRARAAPTGAFQSPLAAARPSPPQTDCTGTGT